jgi:hypothetical protein
METIWKFCAQSGCNVRHLLVEKLIDEVSVS